MMPCSTSDRSRNSSFHDVSSPQTQPLRKPNNAVVKQPGYLLTCPAPGDEGRVAGVGGLPRCERRPIMSACSAQTVMPADAGTTQDENPFSGETSDGSAI